MYNGYTTTENLKMVVFFFIRDEFKFMGYLAKTRPRYLVNFDPGDKKHNISANFLLIQREDCKKLPKLRKL